MLVNYIHFNHSSLPGWTDGDSLMAERVDTMVSAARALCAEGRSDCPACAAVAAAFAQLHVKMIMSCERWCVCVSVYVCMRVCGGGGGSGRVPIGVAVV